MAQAVPAQGTGKRYKILLVDDEPVEIRALHETLTSRYDTFFAKDGEEALELAARERPDLILLDVEMPRLDGYSVCQRLRASPGGADVPVIFVTHHGTPEQEIAGLEHGGSDYVHKPFQPDVVLARIQVQLELKARTDRLKSLVTIDSLTGVTNRRGFDDILQTEWSRRMRNGTPLGLILIDIDYFKRYNDSYGHLAGDHALRTTAQLMADTLRRPTDFLARYGGEEFAYIASGADAEELTAIARKLDQAMAVACIPHRDSPFERITLSMGIASRIPRLGQTPQILIEAADVRLYDAKRTGRNRYC